MKTFFSLVLSFFCVLTISQAQSLDSPSLSNPIVDYLNTENIEAVFELFASAESAAESPILGCKCLGDINRDNYLNLLDVALFINAIQNGFNDPCADMNQDGVVDLLDVAPFIEKLESGGC